jgi:hypothetical protein
MAYIVIDGHRAQGRKRDVRRTSLMRPASAEASPTWAHASIGAISYVTHATLRSGARHRFNGEVGVVSGSCQLGVTDLDRLSPGDVFHRARHANGENALVYGVAAGAGF